MAAHRTSAGPRNQLAPRHGAQSETIVAFNSLTMAAEIKASIVASGNYLGPADDYMIERAGRILARLRLLDAYIDRLGGSPIDSRDRMRGCMRLAMSLERAFKDACRELGMTPLARAALVEDVAGARRDHQAAEAHAELRRRYSTDREEGVSVATLLDDSQNQDRENRPRS